MKNTFGNALSVTLFGESHGPAVGAVLDGLAPGIPVDEDDIAAQLSLRRPEKGIGTARRESDAFSILSGVFGGKTTGTPLTIVVENSDTRSSDYEKSRGVARPGHADYTAFCKYHGYEDYRGGGHFSGRLTAALVAAGAIVRRALANKGIAVASHIARLGGVSDRCFDDPAVDATALSDKSFPVLDEAAAGAMRAEILAAASDGDSVGGVLEGVVTGLPAGLGEPFFDSVESLLSHALFSIPGVKGVQFGGGFDAVCGRGSAFNDAMRIENGAVVTKTNLSGGINGGITNGMPVCFSLAVRPTPTIAKEQESVDFLRGENARCSSTGRHDPCILPRAAAAVNALTALTVYDLLSGRFGTDFFGE